MHRLIWVPALALAACGTDDYQRPRTVEYVTEAILAPNCGNAQCHSSFSNVKGYAFDTVAKARASLVSGLIGSISLNAREEPVGDGQSSFLYTVLTRPVDRMPYDQPLLNADIKLITDWIDFGAPGAQCDPAASEGMVCVGTKVVECDKEFTYGAVVKDCAVPVPPGLPQKCLAGVCQ